MKKYPISEDDWPFCSERVDASDVEPSSNGPGDRPDQWHPAGKKKAVSFRKEAVKNDLCYQKCNADRDQCDADFIRGMLDQCDAAYKRRSQKGERASCRGSALDDGRSWNAKSYRAWKDAQRKACQCCP